MPTRTADLPQVLYQARALAATDPVRIACRDRLRDLRSVHYTVEDLARTLACSPRHVRRLLAAYGLPTYSDRRVSVPPAARASCIDCSRWWKIPAYAVGSE